MDPGSVPAELQGLTQTEEMLIARCCPIMRVLHLKGGQLGYGGHVVNVAQDITTFAATLPRLAADVPITIIRREGKNPASTRTYTSGGFACNGLWYGLLQTTPTTATSSLTTLPYPGSPLTPTFSPWAHTSDDSYNYQLSLVLATATVSLLITLNNVSKNV